jgi:RNA polymerase sigma-70 factor (ECF subfamily)
MIATDRQQEPEDPRLRILMAEYQAGSADAFRRLHQALAADVRAYLMALTRDATRADDLVQETFLQIHRARAAHTPGEAVRPWVFAIAKRVFLMYRRSALRRERHEHRSTVDPTSNQRTDETTRIHVRRELESALGQVSPDGRRVVVLHHLFGFSFKEIAVRLGITPGAAKIKSSRALSRMRAHLEALMNGIRDD